MAPARDPDATGGLHAGHAARRQVPRVHPRCAAAGGAAAGLGRTHIFDPTLPPPTWPQISGRAGARRRSRRSRPPACTGRDHFPADLTERAPQLRPQRRRALNATTPGDRAPATTTPTATPEVTTDSPDPVGRPGCIAWSSVVVVVALSRRCRQGTTAHAAPNARRTTRARRGKGLDHMHDARAPPTRPHRTRARAQGPPAAPGADRPLRDLAVPTRHALQQRRRDARRRNPPGRRSTCPARST
jgi:hypothetical protein